MNETFLAIVMLTAPVGTPEHVNPDNFPQLRTAIHNKAVEWEIMDPREKTYILATYDDFEPDLNLLRTRFQDLKDAPKLVDCTRLPDRRTINELVKFNREFKKHLEERLIWETDREDVLWQAINNTELLYKQWDAIRDAQCDFYYVTVRRSALKKLRYDIGETDFNNGKMPDYVPMWAFSKP